VVSDEAEEAEDWLASEEEELEVAFEEELAVVSPQAERRSKEESKSSLVFFMVFPFDTQY